MSCKYIPNAEHRNLAVKLSLCRYEATGEYVCKNKVSQESFSNVSNKRIIENFELNLSASWKYINNTGAVIGVTQTQDGKIIGGW